MDRDPFYRPAWAEAELGNTPAVDSVELQALREFHDAFEAMHRVPSDKLHRLKNEKAAALVIEKCNAVRRIRTPQLAVTNAIEAHRG